MRHKFLLNQKEGIPFLMGAELLKLVKCSQKQFARLDSEQNFRHNTAIYKLSWDTKGEGVNRKCSGFTKSQNRKYRKEILTSNRCA